MSAKSTIPVYVIDSGCNIPGIETIYSFDNTHVDEHGHGTSMISIISALSNASVYSLKIPFQPKLTDILNCLLFLYDNCSPGVLNVSWQMKRDPVTENILKKLSQKEFKIVCPAGHSGITVDEVFPACLPFVINVGSINKKGIITEKCNRPGVSRTIDLYANGTNIPAYNKNLDTISITGTSAACAIVSGLLGRKFFENRDYTKITKHLKFIQKKLEIK